MTSIGAGGGSIAWRRRSRNAQGRSGERGRGSRAPPATDEAVSRPTLTDAFAVLGYVGAVDIGYRAVQVDTEAARRAVDTLATSAWVCQPRDAAESILRIAVSGMYLEVSKLMSAYGVDPRDNALLAFGGAGPMTACFLADELDLRHIVVPAAPGVLSALGGLIADLKNDFIKTVYLDLDDSNAAGSIRRRVRGAPRSGKALAARRAGLHREKPHFLCSADMRYRGQSFEVETDLDACSYRERRPPGLRRRLPPSPRGSSTTTRTARRRCRSSTCASWRSDTRPSRHFSREMEHERPAEPERNGTSRSTRGAATGKCRSSCAGGSSPEIGSKAPRWSPRKMPRCAWRPDSPGAWTATATCCCSASAVNPLSVKSHTK